MKAPWEYMENLNEVFYVVEIETHKLIYMNRYTRDLFGISETDYENMPCYRVLQGLKEPCLFCTNSRMTQEELSEWVYRNPILGKTLRMKATIIEYEGRKYRIQAGLKLRDFQDEIEDSYLIYQETMLNECLMLGCFASNENDLLQGTLEYLCTHLECTGCFIYEPGEDGVFKGTYGFFNGEKNIPGVLPGLQEFLEEIGCWYKMLHHNEPMVLDDMENIYKKAPQLREYLNVYGVEREIIFPLMRDGEMGGILRMDNPPKDRIIQTVHFCKLMAHFISATLRRRDMVNTLKEISYYDQLTGAKNRYALSEFTASDKFLDQLGIIFGDVNGLKHVNDTLGHEQGDQLIGNVCQQLMEIFGRDAVYRMGGDEFLVICSGMSCEEFEKVVQETKMKPGLTENLSIGAVWQDSGPKNFMEMVDMADQKMYTEKRKFHKQRQL